MSLLISQLELLSILNRRKSSSTTSSDGSPRATPTTRVKKTRRSSNSSSRNSVRSIATVDSEEPLKSEMKNENDIENMHSILVKSLVSNLQLDNKNNDHNHGRENEHKYENEIKNEANDKNENSSANYYGDSDDNEASNYYRERTVSDAVHSISPPFSPHSVASTVVSTTQDQYVQKTPSTASTPCRPGILEESIDGEISSSSEEKSRTVISSNNNNIKPKNEDNEDKSVKELKFKLDKLNIDTDNVCGVSNDALALQSVMAALDSALNSPAKPEDNEITNDTVGSDSSKDMIHEYKDNDGHEIRNKNEDRNTHNEVQEGMKKVESEGSMTTTTATANGYSTTHTVPVDDHTHRTTAIDRDYVKVEKEVAGNSNMSDITSSGRPGNVRGITLDEDEEDEDDLDEEDDEDEEEDEEDGDDENDEEEEEEEDEEEDDTVVPGPQIPSTTESTYEGSDVSEENADIENIEVGLESGIKGLRS